MWNNSCRRSNPRDTICCWYVPSVGLAFRFKTTRNFALILATICIHLHNDAPLNCRGGCYFWLDPKVTKRSSPQKCFFALQAFAHKPGKTLGCNYFAGLPYRFNTLYAKTCYALPPSRPCRFSPVFAEALLRTRTTHSWTLEQTFLAIRADTYSADFQVLPKDSRLRLASPTPLRNVFWALEI